MSVVTSIRDYIEIINTHIGPRFGEESVSLTSIIYETIPHVVQMCKDTLWYFISFKGLRENFYQPYLSGIENFHTTGGSPFTDFQLKPNIENLTTTSWGLHNNSGFSFQLLQSFFLTGLGNSFFISIPGSIGTLLILRRLITQGTFAGLAATIGGVVGSCSIMAFVILGNRVLFLNPAFLELFFYLGLLIPVSVILRGLCFSDFRIIPSQDKLSLFSIGFIHFLLGVSNQSTLFRHLRDLTISPHPTPFLGISNSNFGYIYILGFSIGSFLFALGAFYSVRFLINWWLTQSTITRSRLMQWSENVSIIFLTCLCICTFSYYGADFLLIKGFGFLPADRGVSETVLAPNSVFKDPHNLTGVHALYPSNEFSLDPAPFDRPLDKLFRRSILLKEQGFKYRNFEELNYQGEKHWLHKGFRHGSAKPIKTVNLPAEKNKLAEGRALLRSLDKAIGWDSESQQNQNETSLHSTDEFSSQVQPLGAAKSTDAISTKGGSTKGRLYFTNLALEEIPFNFEKHNPLKNYGFSFFRVSQDSNLNEIELLEQKFKRFFFGQIGLLPGRLPPINYGPFDSQEMAHKRLAFSNPVYKALLSFDLDLFLQRQPANHSLSAEDEHNIYLKRQLLERYINTQRDYFYKTVNFPLNELTSPVLFSSNKSSSTTYPESDQLTNVESYTNFNDNKNIEQLTNIDVWAPLLKHKENFFTKSFANQTYKHQFKGTLEVVRQMFAVSLDCPEPSAVAGGGAWDKMAKINGDLTNFFKDDKGLVIPRPKNPRIIKFDQPLYTRVKGNTREFVLLKQLTTKSSSAAHNPILSTDMTVNLEGIEKPQLTELGVSLSHEELFKYLHEKSTRSKLPENPKVSKPFFEPVSISPFYVGWDNDRRQLLLTQRYLSRKTALVFYSQNHNSNNWSEIYSNADSTDVQQRQNRKGQSAEILRVNENNLQTAPVSFATWPVLKIDPTDKAIKKWRLPSRSFEHMLALEEEARLGLDEQSDKNKGLRGSYEGFVDFWAKNSDQKMPGALSFNVSRWPTNITTPSVQADLDNFDQIEDSLFTGVKRGGFLWPGSSIRDEFKPNR